MKYKLLKDSEAALVYGGDTAIEYGLILSLVPVAAHMGIDHIPEGVFT